MRLYLEQGKQIFNVFKEAKAVYDEKKAAIKAERAVHRAQTFDVYPTPQQQQQYYLEDAEYVEEPPWVQRRETYDDGASVASSRRSHGSRFSRSGRKRRPALTEDNLKTHTEVSATPPSRAPAGYQSPYAETAPRDMQLSRPAFAPHDAQQQVPMPIYYEDEVLEPYQEPQQPLPRSRSDPSMRKKKEIDMDLAYGELPPDLEHRVDLDPEHQRRQQQQQPPVDQEQQAKELAEKVENLLTEAHCVHHTANHIIEHLHNNPDAAAAVALTLAELSAILGKVSPSFLAILKGGSPAVFALLASPQFLIAAGLTVGVTVVMFGGWKIVKRIKEEQAAMRLAAQPVPMEAAPYPPPQQVPYPETEYAETYYEGEEPPYDQFDEALVIEEELSSIESWRRGIVPFGEDQQADLELISPNADRAMRSQYFGDDDLTERGSVRTRRSKTHKSTSKTHKSSSHRGSHRRARSVDSTDERASRRDRDDAGSEAGSERTSRSHRSHRTEKTERSSRTTGKSSARHTVKALEDGSRDRDNTIDIAIRPKKDSLLKSIFKKKDGVKEREKVRSTVRVA